MEATIAPTSAARDSGLSLFTPGLSQKPRGQRLPVAAHRADAWSPSEDVATSASTTASGGVASDPVSLVAAVGNRLFELMGVSIEDGEPLPSSESIAGLWRFLDQNPSVQNPLLTSDSEGVLIATWRISTVSMLSIRFIDRTRIEFAWTLQDKNGKVSREWGENRCEDFVTSFRYANEFLGGGN